MKLIYRGAEAELWLSDWYGLPTIIKRRVPRDFLIPQLDWRIRKLRTRREVRMLEFAKKLGIHVPAVYFVNLEKTEIFLEYIEGERLCDIIQSGRYNAEVIRAFGKEVGILHSNGILHGDLTTANVLVCKKIPVIIDFGLSDKGKDAEDFGTEYHLFNRAVETAHPRLAKKIMEDFTEGYKEGNPDKWEEVIKRAEDIRKRGRYIPPEKRK